METQGVDVDGEAIKKAIIRGGGRFKKFVGKNNCVYSSCSSRNEMHAYFFLLSYNSDFNQVDFVEESFLRIEPPATLGFLNPRVMSTH